MSVGAARRIDRQYYCSTERVKCTELHPSEPWILVALYSGQVSVHNFETETIIKTFEVCDAPVRAATFVVRKNWIACGSDDLQLRIFNSNTLEKVYAWEAHVDYIRDVISHPSRPFIITCSDDLLIKVWDWEKSFTCVQTMEGHLNFVMKIAINPKDNSQLASASLDRIIRIFHLGAGSKASFTLEGHEKGVNGVDYYRGGDRPYLVSAADDWTVRVWDYQNKSCVHVLSGHSHNVITAIFHPTLPIIISGSQDGTARIWNSTSFRCDLTLNYGMNRLWSVSVRNQSNEIAVGYDDGVLLLRAGREAPSCCMDNSGRFFLAKQNHIYQASAKNLDSTFFNYKVTPRDGESISFSYKELGTSDVYPHSIVLSYNGRFLAVVGDGEFAVSTTVALRSKIFGNGDRLAWSFDSTSYYFLINSFSTREGFQLVLYTNFHERKRINPGYSIEELFSGPLLGVRSPSEIYFYEWSELRLIIKIVVSANLVSWNSEGTLCCICSPNTLHILKYDTEVVSAALSSTDLNDFGVPNAFEPISELTENVLSGLWVGDCFVYTNKSNRLGYVIGSQSFTIHHIEKPHFVVGYVNNTGRLYLSDKDGNVKSYSLEIRIIEYQIAILNKNFDYAEKIFSSIPSSHHSQIALFLENQGQLSLALKVSPDNDHRFDIAMQLKEIDTALELAEISGLDSSKYQNFQKWTSLGKAAVSIGRFDIALKVYRNVKDPYGLLLLGYCLNSQEVLDDALNAALEKKQIYVAFLVYYLTGRISQAIELLSSDSMHAEASIMAYCYKPDLMESAFEKWQDYLKSCFPKYADRLAHPTKYPNLFPHSNNIDLNEQMTNLQLSELDKTNGE